MPTTNKFGWDTVKPSVLPVVAHSARTAVASLLTAGLFGMPEVYCAPITTLVVTQSSLGTALGAAAGAIVASNFGRTCWSSV